jgi:riboflavin kinase/FMN adenylyltransferase
VKIISWDDFIGSYAALRPMTATVGVFDGLHIGHQELIRRVVAHDQGCLSAAFTFRENPKKLLRPETFKGDLASLGRKLEILETLGLDLVVLIDFSGDFSRMPGRNFLSLVMERGSLRHIAVGSDFHCGKGQDTDSEALRAFYVERSVSVEILEPVTLAGETVSSTRIRIALQEGRVEEATAMLGRAYEMELDSGRAVGDGVRRYERPAGLVLPRIGDYLVTMGGSRERGRLSVGEDGLVLRGFAEASGSLRVSLISLDKETNR